uniref:Son of sevenless 2 n=1 Tax=Aceria tosichella TaxID=561515 RepID=A0A6G1S600_9ACAR
MSYTNKNTHHHIDTLELDPADGQQYICELRDRLLELLSPAQTIEGVGERLRKLYPESKLVHLAINEANKHRSEPQKTPKVRHHSSSSSGASFTDTLHNITSLAVAKVSNLVRDGVVGNKSENELSKYKLALIQFILDDVLNLAGNFVRRQKGNFIITRNDIRTAMHADKDLLDMFFGDDKSLILAESHPILARITGTENTRYLNSAQRMTYKQTVRVMVDSENFFLRNLKLVIKVFKAKLLEPQWAHIEREVHIVFCNIGDLLELSNLMLSALEDALESEDEIPFVGSEILDLALAEEFHAYFTFAYKRLSRNQEPSEQWRPAYAKIVNTILSKPTLGLFDKAVLHLLPNYLVNIIAQFFQYYKNITDLYEISRKEYNRDDENALKETLSILIKTKKAIEDLLKNDLVDEHIEQPESADVIRSYLERELESKLQLERNLPLPYMPPPDIYRFSEPDSPENIKFESISGDGDGNRIPVIKFATLIKLVERLTYHKYQPNIVDIFLTTYTSFISDPEELLDLLIERFKIPDPPLHVVLPDFAGSPDDLPECERTAYKQYIKRFRQEYSKPVKMRVINVLRSWIKNHYQDFERQPNLLDKLNSFLDEVHDSEKVLRGLIVSIKKSIEQQKICHNNMNPKREFMLSREPPKPLEWHAKWDESDKFNILTLHPVEFARQLTLVEFDLFRAINPLELIKVERKTSENLKNLERHFNLLSYWVQKCIVEEEDERRREAIYSRSIEIMAVLRDLNNYIGLLSIGSAIESASINRLSLKRGLDKNIRRYFDDYKDLVDHHLKKLQLELKQCNPPCIPYLGYYQTKLIQAKEGNKTFIDEPLSDESISNSPATPITPRPPPSAASTNNNNQFFGPHDVRCKTPKIINFYKQRIQAEMIADIRNYQDQRYCLSPIVEIQKFIKKLEQSMLEFARSLGAADDMHSIANKLDDYLFEQSKRIEPEPDKAPKSRSKMPPEFKSPGIKF